MLAQLKRFLKRSNQYLVAILLLGLATLINFVLEPIMGYWGLGLIYLLAIVIQSFFGKTGSIFALAVGGTALWNFLFIPPKYTFRIHNPEDILLVIVYFAVAIVSGTLSSSVSKSKLVEESERLHRLLLNTLSHELRTPLATIEGALSNLQMERLAANPELRKSVINEIKIASVRLNQLIANLLDMSRLESGHLRPRLEWCDVDDLVSTSISELRDRGWNLRIQRDASLEVFFVKVDYGLFVQVLNNLLLNSAMYAGVDSEIRIEISKKKNSLLLSISDSGPGIPSELLPHVFEKFIRGPLAKSGGIGLGLAIAKGFVELQGGTIEVRNLKPSGASFLITLPVVGTPDSLNIEAV